MNAQNHMIISKDEESLLKKMLHSFMMNALSKIEIEETFFKAIKNLKHTYLVLKLVLFIYF